MKRLPRVMCNRNSARFASAWGACLAVAVVWAASAGLLARPLAESLAQLEGYQAQMLDSVDPWPGGRALEGHSAELLSELALNSYSRWRLQGPRPWQLTAWEMLDSQGAFGLFAERRFLLRNQRRRTLELPFDHLLTDEGLCFWRGRFLFRLTSAAPRDVGDEDYQAAASAVGAVVEEPNLYPFSVVQLPLLDLDADSVRLYLGENGLLSNLDFPKRLLPGVGFDMQVEVVSARYGPESKPFFLLGYPTASLAEEQAARLNGLLQSQISPEGIFIKRSALLVGLFFGPEEEARKVLGQLQYNAKVKWIYDRGMSDSEKSRRRGEVVTFFGIVTSSLLFTGFFAVVVAVLGCLVGVLRYEILKRFPIVTEKSEMIRLDLDARARKAPD